MFFMFFGGFVILCVILIILAVITRISFGHNRVMRFLSTAVIISSIFIPTILILLMAFGNQFHFSGTYYTLSNYKPTAELVLNWTGDCEMKIYDCEDQVIHGSWEYDYNDLEDYIRLNLNNGQNLKCILNNEVINVNMDDNTGECEDIKIRMRRKN